MGGWVGGTYGFGTEEGRGPEDEVRPFAFFDGANEVAHAVGNGWVDGVFGDIALDSEIVCVDAFGGPLVLCRGR